MTKIIALVLLLAGCAAQLAVAVPTTPAKGQDAAQFDRDDRDCERFAGRAEDREARYGSCMMARGYSAVVPFGGGHAPVMRFDLSHPGRAADDIAADVTACNGRIRAMFDDGDTARRAAAAHATFTIPLVGPYVGMAINAKEHDVGERIFAEATSCLPPLGYTVRPWNPYATPK